MSRLIAPDRDVPPPRWDSVSDPLERLICPKPVVRNRIPDEDGLPPNDPRAP